MKRLSIALALLALGHAEAQTPPGFVQGQVPSAANWNSYFAGKWDYPGYAPGTASRYNTGTAGPAVPLLNAANSWSAAQTFTGPCSANFIANGPCFSSPSTSELDVIYGSTPWHRFTAGIHEIDSSGAASVLRLYRTDATLSSASPVGSIPMGGYDASGIWHVWGWITATAVTTSGSTCGQVSFLVDVAGVPTDILDLNCGSAAFNAPVTATLSGTTGSIGGSSVAAGACTSGTATTTGLTTAMAIAATPVTYPGDGFSWAAYRSGSNTATVKLCNFTSGSLTPTASAYNVRATP